MKLATALSERADLQRRISELGGRLNNNARVQDACGVRLPFRIGYAR